MSALSQVVERLTGNWRLLQRRWQTAKSRWNDEAAIRFERGLMPDLEHEVRLTTAELRKLRGIVDKARRSLGS